MKKSRIFIALGAFALTAGAFLATKANVKKAGVTAFYLRNFNVTITGVSSSNYTTTAIAGSTVLVKSGSVVLSTAVTSSNANAIKVYHH